MKDGFFPHDSSDTVLSRALLEGIGLQDPESEPAVESFLKSAVIEKGMISREELLDCIDTYEDSEETASLTTVLLDKGYIKDNQLGELLELMAEAATPDMRTKLVDNLSRYADDVKKGNTTFATLWGMLEHSEKKYDSSIDDMLKDALESGLRESSPDAGKKKKKRSDSMRSLDEKFIGKTIGPCEVIERIGAGGMGAVYKAKHKALDKNVAVKILSPDLLTDTYRQRFLKEARAAASLEHKNIVVVHDAGEEDGYPYIIMQLVEGKSIGDILAETPKFEAEQALLIIEGAANGLQAAHENGLLHRDIKPDNIMINARGEIIVTDFGLAKEEHELLENEFDEGFEPELMNITAAGVVVGTPTYMSPEQFRTEGTDTRSDIYSLGATFYHMLAGRPPFMSDSLKGLMSMHDKFPPPPIDSLTDNIPPEIGRVVHRMIEKKPEDRYENTSELIEDLRRAFTFQANKEAVEKYTFIPNGRPSTRESVSENSDRKWIYIAASIAIVFVVLAGVLGGVLISRPPADHKQIEDEIVKKVVEKVDKQRDDEMSKRASDMRNKAFQMIEKYIQNHGKDHNWEAAKTAAVTQATREHMKQLQTLMRKNWDGKNSSNTEREFRKQYEQSDKAMHENMASILGQEEAEIFLRKLPEFNRRGRSPRGHYKGGGNGRRPFPQHRRRKSETDKPKQIDKSKHTDTQTREEK